MAHPHSLVVTLQPLPPLSRVLLAVTLTVIAWQLRQRTRKHLAELSPHLLRDIGIAPSYAALECQKPFWRL